jgi:hypothetical protein
VNLYGFVQNNANLYIDPNGEAVMAGVAVPGFGWIVGAVLVIDLAVRGERSVIGSALSALSSKIDEYEDDESNTPKTQPMNPRDTPGGRSRDNKTQNEQAKAALRRAERLCREMGGRWKRKKDGHQDIADAETGNISVLVDILLQMWCEQPGRLLPYYPEDENECENSMIYP